MTVRIGANPIGWSNDDMRELGGETPLETCLAEAREAGFTGMELGHKFPREAGALARALAPFDMALVSGWYSTSLVERDVAAEMLAMRAHLDLLKAMGAKVAIVAETTGAVHGDRSLPLSRRPQLGPAAISELGGRLTGLAEAIAAEGLTLVYHHHMGTVIETEAEIDALMAATGPAFHLLLDTGHATFAGADPVALARRYRNRIAHVHCKDLRPAVLAQARAGDWSFLDAVIAGVFTVPGDGCVDFPAVLRELPGYDGWLVVEAEQDPAKAHPLTYAKLGYANLRGYARDAGLMP